MSELIEKPKADLIPTEELLDEIRKRFDHCIFSGIKVMDAKSNYVVMNRHWGNRHLCIGLCRMGARTIEDLEIRNTIPVPPDQRI